MAIPHALADTPVGSDDLLSLMQAVDPSRSATVKRLALGIIGAMPEGLHGRQPRRRG